MEGELYHVYNRGIEKRVVFPHTRYYQRFIHALRLFNTTRPVNLRDFLYTKSYLTTGVRPLYGKEEQLVDIGAFILMPTHYHLLLRPRIENGMSLFMKKIGVGYTAYFNLKQNRSGVLFQGRYKLKHVDKDLYARHIQAYIPLNALDNTVPLWRENGIGDVRKARKMVMNYPWSSFSSYIGENRFSGIIDPTFVNDFFNDNGDYDRFVFSRTASEYDFLI